VALSEVSFQEFENAKTRHCSVEGKLCWIPSLAIREKFAFMGAQEFQESEEIFHPQPKLYPIFPVGCGRPLSRRTRAYKAVALGGTFDILHAGHRHLLAEAFKLGDVVYIGVTSDRFVAELNKKHLVHSYSFRVRKIREFLRSHRWASRSKIRTLNEPYGPAARRRDLEALVVSRGTISSGRRLNELRQRRGLASLSLHAVSLVRADDGKLLSTTRIRKGEIDPEGKVVRR